jgi:2-oxoacid:acceptor oxidoreductase delta subunit (pyruvate/2-ketoisovalerate family)
MQRFTGSFKKAVGRMQKVTFKRLQDIPPVAISLGTLLWNKTGTWRYLKPKYVVKTPPCNEACPAGNDIEGFMVLVKEGKLDEAWELIREENPFPGVCGRVCFHPCESSCNRREYDEALSIQAIERRIADAHLKSKREKRHPKVKRKERVAIIGSGPSGLTCAYHLARMGYGVTIFESQSSPGGILRVGIPEYRLPRAVLDREIADIESWGVHIKTNTRIGKDISFDDLHQYQAIFIAVGAHRSRRLHIEGEDLEGVLSGLEFLRRIHGGERVSLGEKTVIIGGGNVAVDVARSAWRMGVGEIQMVCLESREGMPASPEEIAETEVEGIQILPSAMPLRITSDGRRVKKVEFIKANLGEPKSDGSLNPIPIPGTEFPLEADSVITAIGEVPDLSFLPQEVPIKSGLIEADEMGFVDVKGIFAGGDTVNPVHTVTGAIGSGKKTALAIHEYLRGEWSREKLRTIQVGGKGTISLKKYFHPVEGEANPPVVHFQDLHTDTFDHQPRIFVPRTSIDERRGGFKEVHPGMKGEEALEEARRCFNCGVCNGCDHCWVYCPDMAVKRKKGLYEIDYDYCKGCGICFEECPRGAIVLEEEGR